MNPDVEYVRLRMAIGAMEAGREVGGSVLVAFDPRAHAEALDVLRAVERGLAAKRREGEA